MCVLTNLIRKISFYDLKRRFRNHCTKSIRIYDFFARINGSMQIMNSKKSFLIDGFPRSANSYSEALVRVVFPELDFSHHCHAACQVRKALLMDKPAIVLLRHPVDAVKSYLIHNPNYRFPETLFEEYCIFHEQLVSCVNDKNLHIILFENVTSNCVDFAFKVATILNIDINEKVDFSQLDRLVKVKMLELNGLRKQDPQPYIVKNDSFEINPRVELKSKLDEKLQRIAHNNYYLKSLRLYNLFSAQLNGSSSNG